MQITNYTLNSTTGQITTSAISPTIITASLQASGWNQEVTNSGTITGPAPLGIFFDATGTTSGPMPIDTFRELGYHFDFGYPTPTTPGTWIYNGEPKGYQIGGPLASHVYETPGTYIASVRAQDQYGNYSAQSVTIVVQDPNTVYSGTNTVCISLVGDFTGAPAGATTTTTVPTALASNTRYLFRLGEDYTAMNSVTSMDSTTDVIKLSTSTGLAVNDAIKFLGTVAGGIVEGTTYYIKSLTIVNPTTGETDITISTTVGGSTFNITATTSTTTLWICLARSTKIANSFQNIQVGTFGIATREGYPPTINLIFNQQPPSGVQTRSNSIAVYGIRNIDMFTLDFTDYVTFLNCSIFNIEAIYCGTYVTYYYLNPVSNQNMSLCTWPKNIIFQENYFDARQNPMYLSAGGVGYWRGVRFAILGNVCLNPDLIVLRSAFGYKTIIAHNYLGPVVNPLDIWAQIKFHAAGSEPFSFDLSQSFQPASQYAVIANNYVPADANNWQFNCGPYNNSQYELCKDFIFENNNFGSDPLAAPTQRALMNAGIRVTSRDNYIAPRPATNNYGIDAHSGVTPKSQLGPYFLPADNALVDNIRVYPNSPTITPQGPIKAVFRVAAWGQEVTDTGTITGPAPLSVFFDATATTATLSDPFRLCGYHFDFGYATPTTPGTWTYSGKPKGNQIGGPTAAHVYETPGTYIASVRAQTPNGNYQDKFVTIVVQDPEVYWTTGGRTTVTLLRSGLSAWPTWQSNTRYLLEAGQNYANLASPIINIINIQNVCIAKTGVGADPIVSDLRFNYTTGASSPTTGARVIFSQLNAIGGDLSATVGGTDCLFYKCSGQNPIVGTLIESRWTAYPTLNWDRPRRICYYENNWDGNGIDLPFFTQAYELILLGNNSARPREHGIRVQGMQYGFIGHNWVHDMGTGPNAGPKDGITIRANGIGPISPIMNSKQTVRPASRYAIVADNLIGSTTENPATCTWPLQISPEASIYQEGSEYILVERTIYNNIPGWVGYPIVEATRGCRNNTVRDSNYSNFSPAITQGTSFSADFGVNPPEWSRGPIYSNTFRSPLPDNIYTFYTPTALLPNKAGTYFNTIFTVSGWGQEVTNTGTITGPAPLAVFFDASETTAYQYNAFREAGYHFDFGYATPSTPGTWTYNGEPKGNQIGGPTAAHVYQTPGTYIASVRAQLPNGLYQDKFVTIIVQDPNTVYSGTSTVCISLAGNFTGAPAGAVTQTTVPTTAQPNTRYLFRCGEDYSAVTMAIPYKTLPAAGFNLQIGSFGTGTKPKIIQTFPNRPYSSSQCQLSSVTISGCLIYQAEIPFGDYVTVHNCDTYIVPSGLTTAPFYINTTVAQWAVPGSTPNYANSRYSRNIVISENTCDAGSSWNIYGGCRNLVILGNQLLQAQTPHVSHGIRVQPYKCFIGHNYIRPGRFDQHYIKMHGFGPNMNFNFDISPYGQSSYGARYAVIADNYTQPDDVSQIFFAFSPTNDTLIEYIQDFIVERNILNKIVGGTGGTTGIAFGGMRITGRTNTFNNFASSSNYYGVDFHVGDIGGVPLTDTSPYYLPAGDPDIDNEKTFATPSPGIYPAKAGT